MTGGDQVQESGRADAPRSAKIGDLVSAASVVGIGAAAWIGAARFPEAVVEGQVGAGSWPRLVAGLMVVLGIALLLLSLSGRGAEVQVDPANRARWIPLVAVLIVLALYPLVWSLLGFVPATVLAFATIGKIFGVGSWLRTLAWSALLAVLVWLLFGQLLQVPL